MPRGNPKRPINLRIEQETLDAVRETGVPLTQAIEEAIAQWLARWQRRQRQTKPARKRGAAN
jgi:hypothetical protein